MSSLAPPGRCRTGPKIVEAHRPKVPVAVRTVDARQGEKHPGRERAVYPLTLPYPKRARS